MARRGEGVRARPVAAALLLLLLAGRPDVAAGQASAGPAERIVELGSRPGTHQPWTDSGIDVAEGERLVLTVEGRYGFASSATAGPEGLTGEGLFGGPLPDAEGLPLPSAPFAAVIGRIGDTLFAVGAGVERAVETGGRLQLGVNLPELAQQIPFSFRVAVTVIPAPTPDPDPLLNDSIVISPPDNAVVSAADRTAAAEPTNEAGAGPTRPPAEQAAEPPSLLWLLLLAALALAGVAALALSKWRRARLASRTRARLAVVQTLHFDPAARSFPPPELRSAWPTVGTRWRVEEKAPAFGDWAGEERDDG